MAVFFFFSSRRRHTSFSRDWSSDVCSSDLEELVSRLLDDRGLEPVGEEARYQFLGVRPLVERARLDVDPGRRSEERRVGKEWKCRRWRDQGKQNGKETCERLQDIAGDGRVR